MIEIGDEVTILEDGNWRKGTKENKNRADSTGGLIVGWNKAENPPKGMLGCWTREVIAVTNVGEVYRLAYYHPHDGQEGCWQRPYNFGQETVVKFWIDFPDSSATAQKDKQ